MLTIEKVKKVYTLIKRLNNLKDTYRDEIKQIEEERRIITLDNLDFVFANSIIADINQKRFILEELLNIYLNKAQTLDCTKISFEAIEIIPTIEELMIKTHITGNKLVEQLYNIAIDFVQANLEGYYGNMFTQKEIGMVLLISDKGVSIRLLKLNIAKKKFYDKEKIEMAIKEVCRGKGYKMVAKECGINEKTLKNEVRKIEDYEILYNDRESEQVGHNEVIERLGGIAIKAGLEVYSEHIRRYKSDLGERFKRIDLVVKREDIIMAAIEVEINNDLTKSINNLLREYKDAKLRILFVSADKLEEAIRIRNDMTSNSQVKIIKIHKDFEKSFDIMLKENKF